MARDLEPDLLDALAESVIRPAILVEMESSSGTTRVWSGIGTLAWPASPPTNWSGLGELGGISGIDETRDVEAKGIKLTLSGIPDDLISLALEDAQPGRAVKVYLAMFDESGQIVVDPYLAFSGLTDAINLVESGETSTIEVSAESDLIRLQRSNESRYTQDFQAIRFPDDIGFEYVEELQEFDIQFGPLGEGVPVGQKLVSSRR